VVGENAACIGTQRALELDDRASEGKPFYRCTSSCLHREGHSLNSSVTLIYSVLLIF